MREPATALTCCWALLAALIVSAAPARGQLPAGPPNAPLVVSRTADRIRLTYDGRSIFDGTLVSNGATAELRTLVDTIGGAVTQLIKWTARGRGPLSLDGVIHGSNEAFAADVTPPPTGLPIVRNSIGPSDSRLNRAVYDRHGDWVLAAEQPGTVTITPTAAGADSVAFRLALSGSEITLSFQPRFYQKHRGLTFYRPWTYRVPERSVAGWSSWYAFLDRGTETDIRRATDVLAGVLLPFGYDYLQIDDGYERLPIGTPDTWLTANDKFPSGLQGVERYIASKGLKPGIWTNVTFADSTWAHAHAGLFVHGPDGQPAYGNWIGWVMDASNPATLDTLIRPVYRGLAGMGWQYFKLDALRHLRYEGYNSFAADFARRGVDRVAAYRSLVQTVRNAIGPDAFLLACWGIRPELIGLVDAVRVGTDGFGYGAFSQYNSFNNVVWRNDPDHIQLSQPDAYRAATLASLTGSLLMLTDRPELYRTARAEIARRTAPVLFTRPEQLYDVDPSRSAELARADVELSGSGPRPFDADQQLGRPLYLLDIHRTFERWSVLARVGADPSRIRFGDLGLDPAGEYLVFEFWSKQLLGIFRGAFAPGPIDPGFLVQDFCIRLRVAHPQLVATNRHVTCGGPDLLDVTWRDGVLSGSSRLVANDSYDIYLTEPAGYRFMAATATGASVTSAVRSGSLRVVRLRTTASAPVSWTIRYASTRH